MRFLLVAARELRSAARQKATYRVRWATASIFFGLLVWLLWASGGFINHAAIPRIFRSYSVLTLLYCLFISAVRTADCISGERREGTLGLLFLSNLNSVEVILGKLCSSALSSVYGLLAIFPMLALPLLMGGITFGNLGRTMLALLEGILCALAAGFLASVISRKHFTAIALALGLTLFLAVGLLIAGWATNSYVAARPVGKWIYAFSPIHTLMAADNARAPGAVGFWKSAAAVAATSFGSLGLTTLLLSRTWRDRARRDRPWYVPWFWRPSRRADSSRRAALRSRLLNLNPVFWLAAPKSISSPVFMFLSVAVTLLTVYVAAPYFARTTAATGSTAKSVLGHLFAWLWAGGTIHALVLYYAANTASQRLAEDKEAGALELILSTPTTERTIFRGLWLAYVRKMMFPAILAVLVHCFFIWQILVMAVLDPPGQIPPGTTPGQLFWSGLLDRPLGGQPLDWGFGFMLRIVLLILFLLMQAWLTLGWVGRWLGLRMKHPGFAPMTSVALLLIPPILLFSLSCYLADKLQLYRLPERKFLPMMFWLACFIGVGHCVGLSLWAATCLRRHLRAVAMSRYQPLPAWRWHLPSRRTFARLAIGSMALLSVITLSVPAYFGYQNWRGRRTWKVFQTALKQSGQSTNLSQLLPGPVPEQANLARSPAFLSLLASNSDAYSPFRGIKPFDLTVSGTGPSVFLLEWSHQTNSLLQAFVNRSQLTPRIVTPTNRVGAAAAIVRRLEPQEPKLQQVARAAAELSFFQVSTNCDSSVVLRPATEPLLLLERVHFVFALRSCALLALGRSGDAAEDVLAGLRLARLARQIPDAGSTRRVQSMLGRSMQAIWEGLAQHTWTEKELGAFQRELAAFDLLADYTNAVQRVIQANIDNWSRLADRTQAYMSPGGSDGEPTGRTARGLQPRAWWYENCIQLHNAGRNVVAQIDTSTGRLQPGNIWSDLNGLPLDSASTELLQQAAWLNANPVGVAYAQVFVNQAVTACALERFRLAKGAYPEGLQKLVPQFLARIPSDTVTGRPMIYQPGANGAFILRSVGPNGLDDRKNSSSDDWLWTFPTNAVTGPN
ncbi:MAG TPA: ABC transporter permease [Verrucomicrobiae bacterium]|nr:ABC transporter permease [Verrucomicrobiae bacterium]